MLLEDNHWRIETYRQKVTRKEWRDYLLKNDDQITVNGRLRKLKAKKIFDDVYEIYKEPLQEE